MFRASKEYGIEHILSLDSDDPQRSGYISLFEGTESPYTKSIRVNDNTCVVEATNKAAQVATGDILIYLSDDFKCPQDWDKLIVDRMHTYHDPLLIKVDDCLQPFNADVLTIPIMNRALYDRLGYFWNPIYRSQFVDQDLHHVCLNNKWLKLCPELQFPHDHYVNGKAVRDETYNRNAANWDTGKKIYHERKRQGFPI